MVPRPAASAIAVPDMPEKITEPMMLTWPRPPRIQPTRATAKLYMRPVTPAMFIRLPARMKNGTASSGKLSTPESMRCASVTSGVMPVTRIYNSDDVAIDSATGRPRSISIRNPPSSSSIASTLRSVERAGALQYRIAAPPVLDRDLDRAAEHQDEAEQHGIIDKTFLELDRRHPLFADDLDVDPDQLDRVTEERDPDQVDDGGKRPRRPMRQIS